MVLLHEWSGDSRTALDESFLETDAHPHALDTQVARDFLGLTGSGRLVVGASAVAPTVHALLMLGGRASSIRAAFATRTSCRPQPEFTSARVEMAFARGESTRCSTRESGWPWGDRVGCDWTGPTTRPCFATARPSDRRLGGDRRAHRVFAARPSRCSAAREVGDCPGLRARATSASRLDRLEGKAQALGAGASPGLCSRARMAPRGQSWRRTRSPAPRRGRGPRRRDPLRRDTAAMAARVSASSFAAVARAAPGTTASWGRLPCSSATRPRALGAMHHPSPAHCDIEVPGTWLSGST